MKPTSIVFLAVSVLLIVGGIITCFVAKGVAAKEEIQLFPEYKDGQSRLTSQFSDSEVTMIDITVQDATVKVFGGAEKSYIEIINYKTNYYTFSKSSRVLTFSEIPDVLSMLKFWENGFSFTGIRNLIYIARADLGDKMINIYISDDDAIKQLKVKVDNGNLTVANLSCSASYDLSVNNGSLTVDGVKTNDRLTINSDSKLGVKLTNVTFGTVKANLKSATFNADNASHAKSAEINIDSGSVSLVSSLIDTNYSLSTKSGKIILWGEEKNSPQSSLYDDGTEYTYKLTITSNTADINVSAPASDTDTE